MSRFALKMFSKPLVNPAAVYDPNLPIPYVELNTGITTYPPSFKYSIEGGYEALDQLEFPVSTSKANLLGGTYLNSAQKIQTVAVGTLNFGLSGIVSGITLGYCRLRRGIYVGPWSNIVMHGDASTPTINDPGTISLAENTTNQSGTLTASTANGYWNTTPSGNDGASFTLVDNGDGTATWQIPAAPDYDTKSSYSVDFQFTSYNGNSVTRTVTFNVLDQDFDPNVFNASAKNGTSVLSNGNLTTSGDPFAGAIQVSRSVRAAIKGGTRKYYMEFIWSALGNNNGVGVGLMDSAASYSNYSRPGASSNYGVTYDSNGTIYVSGGNVSVSGYGNGAVIGVAINEATNKVWFSRNNVWQSGDPNTLTGGHDISTLTEFFPFAGTNTNEQVTANFGSTAFTYTPPTGFIAYDTP